MRDKRSVALGSARVLAGVVGIAVAAASILATIWLPIPSLTEAAPSTTVTPVPADQQRVCAGPLLELAADSTNATSASAFGSVASEVGAESGKLKQKPLKATDDSTSGAFGAPTVLTLPAKSGATTLPLFAGAQAQTATQDDLAGFAAVGCDEAVRSSWLVAGANDLGQTSLVLLSNPSQVQATVDLTVFGETGPVDAPGAQGILVDPGTQRVVALAGIAPDVKAPVVHVQSQGGSIVAAVQQSVVRGLDPGGVELASPTHAPATHQVISGMTVANVTSAPSVEGYSDTQPALRVLVPGDKPARVTVGITAEKGTAAGSSASATLQPKTVQEIPLDRLIAGSFTVTVDSDVPVVVAARTSSTGSAGADFAWFSASRPLTGDTMVAVAKGPGATIHLANQTDAPVTVTVAAPGSADGTSLEIAEHSGVGVAASTPGAYTITGASGLYASVGYAGNGLSSSYPVEPPGALASPITVYPR